MSKPSFIDLVHDFAEARHKHGAAEYNPITRAALDALLAEVEGLRKERVDLRTAAQAVIDRWNSPTWEWHKHGPTADLISDLRTALAKEARRG